MLIGINTFHPFALDEEYVLEIILAGEPKNVDDLSSRIREYLWPRMTFSLSKELGIFETEKNFDIKNFENTKELIAFLGLKS